MWWYLIALLKYLGLYQEEKPLLPNEGVRRLIKTSQIECHKQPFSYGNSAEVYLARLDNNREVAVKLFYNSRQFHHEYSMISSFKNPHPHVVQYYGHSLRPCRLVMELAVNNDLISFINNWAKPDETWWFQRDMPVNLALKIAKGLKYLHDMDILHNDVKPQNIIIDAHMEPKITDFGSAIQLQWYHVGGVFRSFLHVGSVAYSAPESIQTFVWSLFPINSYSKASDTYSLFMVFFVLCTLEQPYPDPLCMGKMPCARKITQGETEDLNKVPARYRGFFKDQWHMDPMRRPELEETIKNFEDALPRVY